MHGGGVVAGPGKQVLEEDSDPGFVVDNQDTFAIFGVGHLNIIMAFGDRAVKMCNESLRAWEYSTRRGNGTASGNGRHGCRLEGEVEYAGQDEVDTADNYEPEPDSNIDADLRKLQRAEPRARKADENCRKAGGSAELA